MNLETNPAAAQEVVSRTGQMGVPVTIAGDEVIIGFDRARLERLATRVAAERAKPGRFGVAARDAAGGGAEVGRVHPGQPADRAGVKPGDIVVEVNGRLVQSLGELEKAIGAVPSDTDFDVTVRRGNERVTLRVPV